PHASRSCYTVRLLLPPISFPVIRQTPTSTLFPYTTLFRSRPQGVKRPLNQVNARPQCRLALRELQRPAETPVFVFGKNAERQRIDRKSTRLNSSHEWISYAVFCLTKKRTKTLNEFYSV